MRLVVSNSALSNSAKISEVPLSEQKCWQTLMKHFYHPPFDAVVADKDK